MPVEVQVHRVESITLTRETLWVDYCNEGPERARPCETFKIKWITERATQGPGPSLREEGEVTIFAGKETEIKIGEIVDKRTACNPELEDEEPNELCDGNEGGPPGDDGMAPHEYMDGDHESALESAYGPND
tara:strand:+ start:536 stop:931 length:396 start_codon:yes stop_codon:yes gene_type:complete